MSNILSVNVSDTMKEEYTTYAMDVIKDRALPDIRDGLKPVHRRVIYSLHDLKITPDKGYRKSARIVGDILGKYHPHGDTAVYDAMVRLAQPWNLRYTLVDGHGNFGSVDGDSAAAMRYTEVRQTNIMKEMVRDLEKNTVEFVPNFDGEEKEPSVLPSRFPNLLVNGSDGIAVGFATKMPPHNLNEIVDGIIYQLENPDCTIKELLQFIKAPDFPTYANIINPQDLENIYSNGYGKIIMRSTHHIETINIKNKEKECIVFTDIPYQVNKAKLVETIAEKSKDSIKIEDGKKVTIKAKIQDIEKVLDESDRNGMRIVVVLKKKGCSNTVLNLLYKHTDIQCNFSVNNTVLINEEPVEHVNLKTLIYHYIKHQQNIIYKRTIFDKNKCEKSLHILQGIQIAIDKLDYTIQLIRNSKNKKEAKNFLVLNLKIDELQAEAILQIQLQRLTNLEKESLLQQITILENDIINLNEILNDPDKLNDILKKELIEIKNKYGDERRTKILNNVDSDINDDLLVESYNTVIQLTKEGYIKKIRATSMKNTLKNKLKENDIIIKEIEGNNKNKLLLFSNLGNVYRLKENDLYDKKTSEFGELISTLVDLEDKEYIINVVSTNFNKNETIIELFDNGNIAKINIEQYNKSNRKLIGKFTNIPINIFNITKDINILLITKEGKALILNTSEVNSVGSRNSKGVVGIKITDEFENNCVIGNIVNVSEEDSFTLVTEKGKEIYKILSDIAPTGNKNEQKTLFSYLQGRRTNQGNFIYNCRQKNDKIIKLL